MKVLKHLCCLCYELGVEVDATHKYYTQGGWYDVCDSCLELVKKDGYETKKIKTIEEVW